MKPGTKDLKSIATLLIAALLVGPLAACGGGADGAASAAGPATRPGEAKPIGAASSVALSLSEVDLAACLAVGAAAPAGECPGYLASEVAGLVETCAGVGGRLEAVPGAQAWSLDVDADGVAEILIDVTQAFGCVGAASVFSCGSLGCPVSLYAKDDGDWRIIGAVNASDAPGIEVLPAPPGTRYRTLRGGCVGERPCDELTHYTWQESRYEWSTIEARGHWVDVAPGGLWTLTADTAVLVAPAKGAAVVERYPAGTVVAVIGNARDADWRYVSPCNACANGFVESGALRRE